MPEYLAPGVYIEEATVRSRSIEGVETSVTGFVGPTAIEPAERPDVLTSLRDFETAYGSGAELTYADGTAVPNFMWHAARAFFENGGRRLQVARAARQDGLPPDASDYAQALEQFEQMPAIAVVAAPGSTYWDAQGRKAEPGAAGLGRLRAVLAHVAKVRHRVAVLDPPNGQTPNAVKDLRAALDSPRAALYYPWVRVDRPGGAGDLLVPPSGFVTGIYARVDAERGVHRAPADEPVRTSLGLERDLTRTELDDLNQHGINCLREMPGRGVLVWGARTLASDPDWTYVNVRRLLVFLEHSIERGIEWAAFEPNDEALWTNVRRTVEDFLLRVWRDGALLGATADKAFFVRCDRTTMTQDDIDNGRLVCVIGVAPVKPAEFVVIRIGLWTVYRKP